MNRLIAIKERSKAVMLKENVRNTMLKAAPVVMGLSVAIAQNPTMYAAGDAKGLMETIIKLVAKLITALAVIMAVVGFVNYASSHADGDGPAQSKAVGKIAAGVMLAALSMILNSQAGNLVGYMDLE